MSAHAITLIFHVLGFVGCLSGSLVKNMVLRQPTLDTAQIIRLRRADRLTGVSTALIVVTGLILLLAVARPAEIYTGSPVFWIKIALFVLVSALVVGTKVDLHRARAPWTPPQRTRLSLRLDFLSLFVMAAMGLWLANYL